MTYQYERNLALAVRLYIAASSHCERCASDYRVAKWSDSPRDEVAHLEARFEAAQDMDRKYHARMIQAARTVSTPFERVQS